MSKKRHKKRDGFRYDANESETTGEAHKILLDKATLEQLASSVVQHANPISTTFAVNLTSREFNHLQEYYDRRLYLYGEINSPNDYIELVRGTTAIDIVESIMNINRVDANIPKSEREPIILYIDSPGGSPVEGFAIIEAIKASKTPVTTVNIGQWSSMAFLIGITGHLRLSLPNMTFLLHDGWNIVSNSSNKVRDRARFDARYEKKVVRKHVLQHTKLSKQEYEKRAREEFYMLTDDALKYGVIDRIVTDINDIL